MPHSAVECLEHRPGNGIRRVVERRLGNELDPAARRRGLQKTPLQYLRDHLVVTMSGNWFAPAFLCTLLALGADNLGTGYELQVIASTVIGISP